jgi:hypothetical protein
MLRWPMARFTFDDVMSDNFNLGPAGEELWPKTKQKNGVVASTT